MDGIRDIEMPTLLLEYSSENRSVQTKISKKHLRFDVEENRMLEFVGGKIITAWNEKTNCFEPKAIDAYVISKQKTDNRQYVQKWVNDIGARYGVEVNRDESINKGLAIDVDPENIAMVESALDGYGIRYSEV